MNKFLDSIVHSFAVWVTAAGINTVLSTVYLCIDEDWFGRAWGIAGVVLLMTLLFSIPAVFIYWLLFITHYNRTSLLQTMLKTSIVNSTITGIAFLQLLDHDFQHNRIVLLGIIITAAIAAVLLHANKLRHIIQQHHHEKTV